MSVVAVAVVGGALITANAASDASDAQTASADKATALQEPFRQIGLSAGNRLTTLLGLTTPSSAPLTRDSLRAKLLPQYTTGGTPSTGGSGGYTGADLAGGTTPGTGGTVDEAGLNAEIDRQMAAQASQGVNDPEFGSLMKDFSMADYQADPGLQFRREQGEQGLQRSAAAHGSVQSGRAMKDAMAYNSGLASQEYSKAFDRFQVNRSNKLNPLQSLMGVGQTATNAISSNVIGAGNAQAASSIAQGNALTNGINQGASMYKNSQLPTNRLSTIGGGGLAGTVDDSFYA